MNQIKKELIDTINEIPDMDATSVEKVLNSIIEKYNLLKEVSEPLNDIKNNNVMTLEELRKDVANWK